MKTESRSGWLFARFATSFIVVLASKQVAVAQFGHSDIDFAVDGGKLITDKLVYDSFFPTQGISSQFSSNPGFVAESDGLGTLGGRYDIVYDVLDNLFLWDGQQFVPPATEVRIRIDNNPPGSNSTFVDSQSGLQPGSVDPPTNRVGASSANGEVHSHVNFFLEPTDDDVAFGAYGIKLAISTKSDQIVDSDPIFLVFNFGLDASTFETGLAEYESLLTAVDLVGDFDSNGELDAADINRLTEAVLEQSPDPVFDVNADGQLNASDRVYWVDTLRGTYFGDANLDGEFSSSDLVAIFAAGEYEDNTERNSTWQEGDWSGDLDFTTTDLVLAFASGGYEQGPRAAVARAIPEPNGLTLLVFGMLAVAKGLRSAARLKH